MDKVSIVSLNVRGLRGDKRHTIFRWLMDNEINIALLQETFCTESFVAKFNKNWKGDILHSVSNSSQSRGVCVMFRKNLSYKIINHYHCDQGRLLIV